MGKTIEICHFKSFDRLLEKAEELERYFQPPAKPDEHYKLVFKKKRDAQYFDNCPNCHVADDEQAYLFWYDTLNCAMALNKKHKNMVKRDDLIEWMGIVEQKKERLKARYELKSLPERFESQRDYYDIELGRTRKESKIKIDDLERKVHVLNQKISELDVANVNVREESSLMKIEMEKTLTTVASLTNQNRVLEDAHQLMQTEHARLNDQLTIAQRDLDAKNDELIRAKERIHELQQNLAALIERASDNLSDLPGTVEANSNGQVDLSLTVDATVESLECRICCERDKQKSCLPCGHILCTSCAEQTIRQSCHCPFCRRRVSLGEVVTVYDS